MRGCVALVFALVACTPVSAERESPTPPPPAAVEPPAASETIVESRENCLEVVDFDEQLAALEVREADRRAVRKQLEQDRRDFVSRSEDNAKAFGAKMKDPLAALVPLLVDPELGDEAASTMFAIDRERAAPLVFASMPRSDRNVQARTFKLFLRLALGSEPICWDAIVGDAARRTLDAGTNADAAEPALLALGLVGGPDDAELLRRYLDSKQAAEYWTLRLRNAALAALARLDDEASIDAIRRELDVPVAKQMTFDRAVELTAAIDNAGFSHQRTFVPLLCRHLASPHAAPDIDMIPPSPSEHAARALAHILDDANLDAGQPDIEAWKQRCAQ